MLAKLKNKQPEGSHFEIIIVSVLIEGGVTIVVGVTICFKILRAIYV